MVARCCRQPQPSRILARLGRGSPFHSLALRRLPLSVIVDFTSDWKQYVEHEIASQGYAVDAGEDLRSLSYKFFNLKKRRISATPRKVLEAKTFSCPATLANGYALLKKKLEDGHDVCPHLSKFLLRDDYEDTLLNDWGIHHFHLGQNPEKSGFIERTGPLLFAHVTADFVFHLGVYSHGSWTQQDLIRVIHENWPDVISSKKIKDIIRLSHTPTDDEISQLRTVGVQAMVQVAPGIVYGPLGGGYSVAGTSVESTMRVNSHMRLLRNLEDHIKENTKKFTARISELGYTHGSPPSFALMIDDKGFFAVEKSSGVAFLVHPHADKR